MKHKNKAPFSDYSVNHKEYDYLVAIIRKLGIINILEFGPGVSTFAFLENNCKIWSLEYNDEWLEKFSGIVKSPAVKMYKFDNKPYISVGKVDNMSFDLGFIDSPTGGCFINYCRLSSALYASYRCKYIIIHDADRKGEKNTISVLREMGWKTIEAKHRLHVLKKTNGILPIVPRKDRKWQNQ
jgi:hypothetical protein